MTQDGSSSDSVDEVSRVPSGAESPPEGEPDARRADDQAIDSPVSGGRDSSGHLFDVLSHRRRRRLLALFEDQAEGDFPLAVEEVAASLAGAQESIKRRDVLVSLDHQHLPKMADAGIVTYDRDAKTIDYAGHPELRDGWVRVENPPNAP